MGALAETGVIGMLANGLIDATGGNVTITMLVLLIGRLRFQLPDNIPPVATMIPILLAMESTGMDVTPPGGSRVAGRPPGRQRRLSAPAPTWCCPTSAKKHGYEITFAKFFKTGFPIALLTILIAGVSTGGALPSSVKRARARGGATDERKLPQPLQERGVRMIIRLLQLAEAGRQRGSVGDKRTL